VNEGALALILGSLWTQCAAMYSFRRDTRALPRRQRAVDLVCNQTIGTIVEVENGAQSRCDGNFDDP
jgi:hypothetical protein